MSTWTRQNFEFIANTIHNIHDEIKVMECPSIQDLLFIEDVNHKTCDRFANKLEDKNPLFDREKFLEACKIKVGE